MSLGPELFQEADSFRVYAASLSEGRPSKSGLTVAFLASPLTLFVLSGPEVVRVGMETRVY